MKKNKSLSGKIKAINLIDFGEIDGLYDSKLSDYFLDNNYWESIVTKKKYFIIGRKGTGKSALYNWIEGKQYEKGILVSNLSFKDFPFEKLLKLSDDNFTKPNQYQSIWRNIIYSEIANLIVKDQKNEIDDLFRDLRNYVLLVFGTDITDLHKQVTRKTEKTENGLKLFFKELIGYEQKQGFSKEIDLYDGYENLTKINKMLEQTIHEYLKIHNTNKYVIQFDQLDDNYTTYINNDEYFQSIISLFKSIYDINQTLKKDKIDVQIIAYLRSDIYNSIDVFDAESARWDQFKFNLNWAIINKTDWSNPPLIHLINKRIYYTFKSLENKNAFKLIFENGLDLKENGKKIELFRYIIHRTFHRPRDIVQFCIYIQEHVRKTNEYYHRIVKNAEKEYSLWLLKEVANEISPKVNNLHALYDLLRLFGRSSFSIYDFKRRYSRFRKEVGLEDELLLELLYTFGIVSNIKERKTYTEYYSIVRNDRSVFNRDLRIIIHPGFSEGLYSSKFSDK